MADVGFSPKRLHRLARSLEQTARVARPLHRELAALLDEVDQQLDGGRKATRSSDLLWVQHGSPLPPPPGTGVRAPGQATFPQTLGGMGLPGSLTGELHALSKEIKRRLRRFEAYEKKHKINPKSAGADPYVVNNKLYPKFKAPGKPGPKNRPSWLDTALNTIGGLFSPENIAADTEIVGGAALAALGMGAEIGGLGLDLSGIGAAVGVPAGAVGAMLAAPGAELAKKGVDDYRLNHEAEGPPSGGTNPEDGSGSSGPSGSIDESEKTFNPKERRIADLLKDEGKNVKALNESTEEGVKMPDSRIDGVETEFKSLNPNASWSTVKSRINDAKKQARHVVIDARDSGLPESEARKGIGMFLKANGMKRMDHIRIIGDGYDVQFP